MPWQPIDQLAAAEQKLGNASADFPYSFLHYLFRLGKCGFSFLIGVLLFAVAIGTIRDDWRLPLVCVLLAFCAFGVSGYITYLSLAWPHLRVKVFPAGLLSIEKTRFLVIYWGQVDTFWQKITIHLDN